MEQNLDGSLVFWLAHSRVAQYSGWFTEALAAPEIKAKLVGQGLYPIGACGVDFATSYRKENDDLGRVIREADIKAE